MTNTNIFIHGYFPSVFFKIFFVVILKLKTTLITILSFISLHFI